MVDDEQKEANFCGHKVQALSALKNLNYDRIIMALTSIEPITEKRVWAVLETLGVPTLNVVSLLALEKKQGI